MNTTAASYGISVSNAKCGFYDTHQSYSSAASYNLTIGAATADCFSLTCWTVAHSQTHDLFTLNGPPSGLPVTFTVQMLVTQMGGGGNAMLTEGTSNSVSVSPVIGPYTQTMVSLSVTRAPRDTFDLYMDMFVGGSSGHYNVSGSLSFPDLPPGYGVSSCQGFISGDVVSARMTSWGRLKSIYR